MRWRGWSYETDDREERDEHARLRELEALREQAEQRDETERQEHICRQQAQWESEQEDEQKYDDWADQRYRVNCLTDVINARAESSSEEEFLAWISALYLKHGSLLFNAELTLLNILKLCNMYADGKWVPLGEEVATKLLNVDTCSSEQLADRMFNDNKETF